MKKKWVFKMLVFNWVLWIAGMPSSIFAGTIGNPAPGISTGRWQVTGELDNWDKDMDDGIDFEGTRVLAKLAYAAADGILIYGRLGLAEIEYGTRQSGNDFAFGLGAKVKVYEDSNMKVGVTGQVLMFSGDIADEDYDFIEVDIACGISHQITEALLGYAGLSISKVEVDFDRGDDIGEDDPFHFFGGVEFAAGKNWGLGMELKFLGESSITILANYDF